MIPLLHDPDNDAEWEHSGAVVRASSSADSLLSSVRPSVCPTARRKEARFTLLKREGNDLVKQGDFEAALHKYDECLALKPDDCALYTNRCGAFKDGSSPPCAADYSSVVFLFLFVDPEPSAS